MRDTYREMLQNEKEPTQEAKIGAKWWADFLRNPEEVSHDNGDAMQSAMANTLREKHPAHQEPFDADKVDEFERLVAEKLQGLTETRSWDAEEPYMGQTYIKCDYHAHPVLQASADEVGLEISDMSTFPVKTGMWLDPGEVRVSVGYQGNIETVWEVGNHLADIRFGVESWSCDTRVMPTPDYYIIRAYKEIEVEDREWPKTVGQDFTLPVKNIVNEGLMNSLGKLENEMEEWRNQ